MLRLLFTDNQTINDMGQNKDNINQFIKGATPILLTLIGLIASGGCLNWACSKSGEGFYIIVAIVNAICWIWWLIKSIRDYRQRVRDDVAAAKAAREAELRAKWPKNKNNQTN